MAFQAIKKAFSSVPVLLHIDPDKECTLETNASNYVSGAVLSQPDHESILWPSCLAGTFQQSVTTKYMTRNSWP